MMQHDGSNVYARRKERGDRPLCKEAPHGVCYKHRRVWQGCYDMCQVIIGLGVCVRAGRLVTAGAMAPQADSKTMMTMLRKPWKKIFLHTIRYKIDLVGKRVPDVATLLCMSVLHRQAQKEKGEAKCGTLPCDRILCCKKKVQN